MHAYLKLIHILVHLLATAASLGKCKLNLTLHLLFVANYLLVMQQKRCVI